MDKILVIKDISSMSGLHLSMYSKKERAIIVEYRNNIIKFQESRDGL